MGRSVSSLLPKPAVPCLIPVHTIYQAPKAPGQHPTRSQWRCLSATCHGLAKGDQTPNVAPPSTEPVYVLTLLTASKLEGTMNALRKKYYAPYLNRLPAHLTLFHALPKSKLEDSVIPTMTSVAAKTSPYLIHAAKATRMPRGVLVHAHHISPVNWTRNIHCEMRTAWWEFLSKQDRGKVQLHWTVMNKEQDQAKVGKAATEIEAMLKEKAARLETWGELQGSVEGLVLWRYDNGEWKEPRKFWFGGQDGRNKRDAVARKADGAEFPSLFNSQGQNDAEGKTVPGVSYRPFLSCLRKQKGRRQ